MPSDTYGHCLCDPEHAESWHQQGCPLWDADADHTFRATLEARTAVSDDALREALDGAAFYEAVCRNMPHPRRTGNFNADLEVSRNAALNGLHAITTALTAAQSERDAEAGKVARLEAALIWCSGSADFAEGGQAREGWQRICAPLLAPQPTGDRPMTAERAVTLRMALTEVSTGIAAYSIYTACTAEPDDWHLIIDLTLDEGPVAKFADLLFHGSRDAHEINGELFLAGGFSMLNHAIQKAEAKIADETKEATTDAE